MEQKIGIIVNSYHYLQEFCKKRGLKPVFKLIDSPFGLPSPILNYFLILYDETGEQIYFDFGFVTSSKTFVRVGKIYKSATALGRGVKSARDNAAFKLLRAIGESEFQVDIGSFSEQ